MRGERCLRGGTEEGAILIGFVSDTVTSVIGRIEEGQTKVIHGGACRPSSISKLTPTRLSHPANQVCEVGHTLILGWNESTVRIVCQIAFLRRAWRVQNETIWRRLFPWTRVPPSSPVAKFPVVILANNIGKMEMDAQLGAAMAARGISPKRTKIGWDVVTRQGNPADVHDLIRVNAHKATSIITMVTVADEEEYTQSEKMVHNGATIRTVLALRHVRRGPGGGGGGGSV